MTAHMQICFKYFPGNLSFAGGPFARKPHPLLHCPLPGAIFRSTEREFASHFNRLHRVF